MEKKIGLVLSGGGARGWAHIGVLKALEENDIRPQYLSGTSAGAVVGVIYACGKTPDEMLELAKTASLYKVYREGLADFNFMPRSGLTRLSYLKRVLEECIPASNDFKDLKKKLFVCVTNLNKGDYEIIQTGSITDAVIASASIPILFKPQKIGNHLYVDGGLVNNLPVEPIKSFCDCVIGVNVNNHQYEAKTMSSMKEIGQRSYEIIIWNNTKTRLRQCDIAIEPMEIMPYALFDFKKSKEIFQLAYESTKRQMPEIRSKLKACLAEKNVDV